MGRLAELFAMKPKEAEKPLDMQLNVDQRLSEVKDKLRKNDTEKGLEVKEAADQKKKVAAEQVTNARSCY